MRYRTKAAICSAVSAVALLPALQVAQAALPQPRSPAVSAPANLRPIPLAQLREWKRINAEMDRYERANPTNFAGLERLALRYTGERISVSVPGAGRPMNGEKAQRQYARYQRSIGSGASYAAAGGIPNFSVNLVGWKMMTQHPRVRFRGRCDFPNSWAGQRAPQDFASLSFTSLPPCVQITA